MFETSMPSKWMFYDENSFSKEEADKLIPELLEAGSDSERNSIIDFAMLIRAATDFKSARTYCSAGVYVAFRMEELGYVFYAEYTKKRIDHALDIWMSRHENKIKKSKRA